MTFDYTRPAELFMAKRKGGSRQPLTCRRFASASEAIRFAVEEFPAVHSLGVAPDARPKSHCAPNRHVPLPSLRAQIVHTPATFYSYMIQVQGAHNKGLSMSCDNMTAKISSIESSVC
jgi:hypothetical protein